MQIDVEASIDVQRARTRGKRPILNIPNKVQNSDIELENQVYKDFSDLFTSDQFGPERTFQAASSEHSISMFLPES
eukprot:1224783-Ditylum_brightwellii.AAC.1